MATTRRATSGAKSKTATKKPKTGAKTRTQASVRPPKPRAVGARQGARAKSGSASPRRALASLSADEETLLTSASKDVDILPIYGDWLEEHADVPRAKLVRAMHALTLAIQRLPPIPKPAKGATKKKKDATLSEAERAIASSAEELITLAEALPKAYAAWIDRLAARPLEATHWEGSDSDKTTRQFDFRAKRRKWSLKQVIPTRSRKVLAARAESEKSQLKTRLLEYQTNSSRYANAVWRQVGPAIAMNYNEGYAQYFGVIAGDVVFGVARNIRSHKWNWRLWLEAPLET